MKINRKFGYTLAIGLTLVFSNLLSVETTKPTYTEQIIAQARAYKAKYKVECVNQKITDNRGDGFPKLYGTRNMRPILHGVAYRGGANNAYHKTDKRDNHNPLPQDGLKNLCVEGFAKAVYLYGTNFQTAEKTTIVNKDTLRYIQNSGMPRTKLKDLMQMIYDVIQGKSKGPIYLHCWNGWHQSGYVSSAILRQFCKYSSEQAFDYWMENTDGVNKGYDNVKNQVKDFKPFDEFQISDEIRKEICPCMKKQKD